MFNCKIDKAAAQKIFIRLYILFAFTLCFQTRCDAQTPTAVAHAIDSLDVFIKKMVDSQKFSGVVLVSKFNSSSSPLFSKAYGLADFEKRIPITASTKFITASTAKCFTAVAIMQLADEGKIDVNSPLSQYLPDSEYPDSISSRITIKQLLTHTAGLGDVIVGKPFRSQPKTFYHLSQIVKLVREESPSDSPGKFHYGDSDYVLLGAVIEQISGQSFSDFMHLHIFVPAGMINSGFDVYPRPANLAHGYTARKIGNPAYSWPLKDSKGDTIAVLHPNDVILPNTGVPGAVAYTTAADLSRFANALVSGKLIKTQTLTECWTGKIETGQSAANKQYGYGFFVGRDGNTRIINHGGTGPGIDVCFDIYPDQGYVVVVLSNLDPPTAQDIRQYTRDRFSSLVY